LRRRFKCQIERNSKLLDNYYDNLNDFVTLQQKKKKKKRYRFLIEKKYSVIIITRQLVNICIEQK
jgi:intergrase/recombinase